MKQEFFNLKINTAGQRLYEFTDQTIHWINKNNFKSGMLNLSIQHTSASLIVQENDDMPAHIKSALTNNQISLSIKDSELLLGTWQGLYLFEHRLEQQNRTIIHHFIGDI